MEYISRIVQWGLHQLPLNPRVFSSRFLFSHQNPALNVDVPTLRNTLSSFISIPLKPPFPAVEGAFGIYTESNSYVLIGDCLEKQLYNIFDNLRCGIYADQTDMDIVNNTFQNIVFNLDVKKGCSGWPSYFGTAIKAVGDLVNNNPHYINIGIKPNSCIDLGNIPFALKNEFNEVFDAISVSTYNTVEIRNNNFSNTANISSFNSYGFGRSAVWISEPLSDNFITISQNTFNNYFNG